MQIKAAYLLAAKTCKLREPSYPMPVSPHYHLIQWLILWLKIYWKRLRSWQSYADVKVLVTGSDGLSEMRKHSWKVTVSCMPSLARLYRSTSIESVKELIQHLMLMKLTASSWCPSSSMIHLPAAAICTCKFWSLCFKKSLRAIWNVNGSVRSSAGWTAVLIWALPDISKSSPTD